jgi:hypothetical protein
MPVLGAHSTIVSLRGLQGSANPKARPIFYQNQFIFAIGKRDQTLKPGEILRKHGLPSECACVKILCRAPLLLSAMQLVFCFVIVYNEKHRTYLGAVLLGPFKNA